MLILTRSAKTGVVIAHPDGTIIRARILQIGTGRHGQPVVVLGLDAPRSVTILREELLDARRLLGLESPMVDDKPSTTNSDQ